MRTLQDPDTFRDLLYAVVTGQRNNEDSRRKGRASTAGRGRAAARGEYIGYRPDGYRLAVDIDPNGQIRKQLVFDAERQPLIELIFALALRGKRSGAIARAVTDAGWQTKPAQRGCLPRPFTVEKINQILRNRRYAGLAIWNGEVVARGHWPAYITERQHERIKRQLATRRGSKEPRQLETYLLARLGSCGRCGKPLYVLTGSRRRDGTFSRRYACAGHVKERGRTQCAAAPIDAHTAEAMVVSSIGALLIGTPEHEMAPESDLPIRREAAQQRLREAILSGDEKRLARTLEELFAAMQPEATLIRDAAISQRQARELTEAERLRA